MEEFIKKGWAEKYFPLLRKLPEITEKALDKPRVKKDRSLQTMCLQKLIKKTMEKESVEEIYYKLLFLEPLDVVYTLKFLHSVLTGGPAPPPPRAPTLQRGGIEDLLLMEQMDFGSHDISIVDPLVFQYLLEQNLQRYTFDEFRIHVQPYKVSVFGETKILLQAPTKEMFDNDLAVIYGKIALDKGVDKIDIHFDEINNRPRAERTYWLSGIVKQFPMVGSDDPRYAPLVRSYKRQEYLCSHIHSLRFYNKEANAFLLDLSEDDERPTTRIYLPDN